MNIFKDIRAVLICYTSIQLCSHKCEIQLSVTVSAFIKEQQDF